MRTAHLLRATLLFVLDALQLWNALVVQRGRHPKMTLTDRVGRCANVRPLFGEGSAIEGTDEHEKWRQIERELETMKEKTKQGDETTEEKGNRTLA